MCGVVVERNYDQGKGRCMPMKHEQLVLPRRRSCLPRPCFGPWNADSQAGCCMLDRDRCQASAGAGAGQGPGVIIIIGWD